SISIVYHWLVSEFRHFRYDATVSAVREMSGWIGFHEQPPSQIVLSSDSECRACLGRAAGIVRRSVDSDRGGGHRSLAEWTGGAATAIGDGRRRRRRARLFGGRLYRRNRNPHLRFGDRA